MKNPLLVLLPFAVTFFFLFGTAFAGNKYTYKQAYDLLDDTAKELIDADRIAMEHGSSQYTDGDLKINVNGSFVPISKEAAKELFKQLSEAYCDAINAEVKLQKDALDELYAGGMAEFEDGVAQTTAGETFSTADISAAGAAKKPDYDVASDPINNMDALKAEFNVVKKNQLNALSKIDTTVYSTTKADGASETPVQIAERLVDQALAQVNGYNIATNDTDEKIAAKITYIKDIYTAGVGTGAATGALAAGNPTVDKVDYKPGLNSLAKSADEVKDSAKLDYAKTKVLATLTSEINTAKEAKINGYEAAILAEKLKDVPNTKTIAQDEENIEKAKEDYAKILEVVTYYVNYQDDYNDLATYDSNNVYTGSVLSYADATGLTKSLATVDTKKGAGYRFANYTQANMIAMADAVAQAKKDADLAKATIDIAGDTYVEIDNLLEDAIEDIYINGVVSYSFASTAEDYLYHYVEGTLIGGGVDQVRINTVDYDGIASWYNDNNYDKNKQADAKAAVKAAKAAVRAAATVDEANTAFLDGWKAFDEIITKAEHQKDFTFSTGKYKAKYDEVKAELTAYANYKNNLYNATNNFKSDAAKELAKTYTTNRTGKFYTDCFNDTELVAMLAEAKSAIDNLQTTQQLKDAATAINTELDALPKLASITLADKDTVMAVYDKVLAHNEYCESIKDTANEVRTGTILMLVKKISDFEEEAIGDAYAAVAKGGITVEDANAISELRTSYDTYNAYWDKYDDVAGIKDATLLNSGKDLTDAEDDLLAAQVKEVVKLVNALPATNASVDAVNAAKTAFDALGRDGKDDLYHAYPTVYSKLIDLQKLSTGNVETLKITASSTAKKGSITVKWTVKGDASAAQAYEIWKSTKKSSGFKKAFTTKDGTKRSYKNTKGLKKGTRYYYKVRAIAYDENGTKIKSDWSNKAYRKAL